MCAAVHEEILEARCQGHTNLYLNYRKLSELPEELLTLSKTRKLYLKRNILTKLVRGTDCFRTDNVLYIDILTIDHPTFVLQPTDIWRLENLVEL